MGAKEQEAYKLETARERIRNIAALAMKSLDDDDIRRLCETERWFMNHLADTIIDHMGRAK